MARMADWQREAHLALRRELWTLRGPNSVVKVVAAGRPMLLARGGYITVGKSLVNKTPEQIVAALGLKAVDYSDGVRIYRFMRLPQTSEYEYDLTAQYPGGLAYNPTFSDPSYPPGSAKIHQWKIRDGIQIAVDSKNFLDLKPGQSFPPTWL